MDEGMAGVGEGASLYQGRYFDTHPPFQMLVPLLVFPSVYVIRHLGAGENWFGQVGANSLSAPNCLGGICIETTPRNRFVLISESSLFAASIPGNPHFVDPHVYCQWWLFLFFFLLLNLFQIILLIMM